MENVSAKQKSSLHTAIGFYWAARQPSKNGLTSMAVAIRYAVTNLSIATALYRVATPLSTKHLKDLLHSMALAQ